MDVHLYSNSYMLLRKFTRRAGASYDEDYSRVNVAFGMFHVSMRNYLAILTTSMVFLSTGHPIFLLALSNCMGSPLW